MTDNYKALPGHENTAEDPADRPRLGVSSCLLGNEVRFDGGHKRSHYIVSELSECIDFVPVCPELEAGFGLPRPALQLRKQHNNEVRMVFSKQPAVDVTDQLLDYAEKRVVKLQELDGFIFKKDSPSCGVFRTPVVQNDSGYRSRDGRGLFADCFIKKYPLIPVEEEGRLNDAGLRENFFERVYAWRRWKHLQASMEKSSSRVSDFIEFHARHKMMLMARGSEYYQQLGRIVAGTTRKNLAQRKQIYIERFMQVMKVISKPGRQVNVLQHIMGYLKRDLSKADKQELLSAFEAYRNKQIPLITPVILLRHYLRINPQPYITKQHYLNPFPEKLALRSLL